MSVINPDTAQFTWAAPLANVDGSPLTPDEITGYLIGIRPASSAVGVYPIQTAIANPAAVSEAVSALGTVLKPDTYAAAIQTSGPVVSAWSDEIQFTIAPPAPPVPLPPSGFSVG